MLLVATLCVFGAARAETPVPVAPAAEVTPVAPVAPVPPVAPAASGVPVGDAFIAADIPGARILVDGQPTGLVTPVLLRGLPSGAHVVVAETDCARGQAGVQVVPDRIARVELTVAPGLAVVDIVSAPPGATLFVDGVEVGPAPFQATLLGCAEHVIVARAPGHLEARTTLLTPAFQAQAVSLVLEPERFGVLVLDLAPVTARSILDGKPLAPGPQTIEPIGAGEHKLVVEARGHLPYHATFEVRPDEVTRLAVTLESAARARQRGVRLAANSVATAAAVGLGALSGAWYAQARTEFGSYLAADDDEAAAALYADRVQPLKVRALIGAAGAVAVAGGSAVLWVTTDFGGQRTAAPVLGVTGTW